MARTTKREILKQLTARMRNAEYRSRHNKLYESRERAKGQVRAYANAIEWVEMLEEPRGREHSC